MCNFVPGEVVAIAPLGPLNDLGRDLPGDLSVSPLVTEIGDLPSESPFIGLGVAVLRTDPGIELLGLSQMSARLSAEIMKGTALVDLNHIVPLSAEPPATDSLRLSSHSERLVISLRALLRGALGSSQGRLAMLDSGLAPSFISHRKVTYLDYTAGGRLQLNAPRVDPLGHGTRVAKILDEVLPVGVDLVVGRLPSAPSEITCLHLAHAVGDLVARTSPDVLNLSVAPRDDTFRCRNCGQHASIPAFLPTFFSLMVRLAGTSTSSTVTVMAAGNSGQVPNSRWLADDLSSLLIAVAENRRGERARYSSAPQGPFADLFSASVFGGDDPDEPGAIGAFADGTHGTSFAAPFLAAATLLAKRLRRPHLDGQPSGLGQVVQDLIRRAERGHRLHLRPAEE